MSKRAIVLVVEDDEDLAWALAELMKLQEIEAVTARNATEAIDRLKEGLRPCVIVLDLGLPVVGGREFLEIWRGFGPELASTPVIVITGTDATLAEFADLGVVGIFRKPRDLGVVIDRVRMFCDQN